MPSQVKASHSDSAALRLGGEIKVSGTELANYCLTLLEGIKVL